MNVFHKVALAGLRRNRSQTVVTVIGVILSAAMITAVASFGVSLLDYVIRGAVQNYGPWHVGLPGVSPQTAAALADDPAVARAAAFDNVGYAPLEGGKNPDKPYLFVAGFTRDAYDLLPVTLLSGRLPQNDGEVLVPSHLAANGGVRLAEGDTLTLALGTRQADGQPLTQHDPYRAGQETLRADAERTFTVVGFYRRPSYEERSAPGYTLITAANGGAASVSAFVSLKHPADARRWAAAAGQAAVLNDQVLRFMGVSDDTWFNTLLYTVVGVVVAIVMVGSVFLIHNAFSISLNERMRQIGVLASVGATARQLRGMVLFEGACIGAAGIPLGILLGLAGIGLVLRMVAQSFGDILYSGVALTLVVSPAALVAAALISLATILISAYIPAKRAAAAPVMECIRQTGAVKADAGSFKIPRWQSRLGGLEGTLALKSFKRNKKRYRSVVFSLVLSIVLFIASSGFVTYLRQASEMATVFTTYDIGFHSEGIEDHTLQAVYDQLKTTEGVTAANYQQVCAYRAEVPAKDLSSAYWDAMGGYEPDGVVPLQFGVQFFDDETFLSLVKSQGLPAEAYTGPRARLLGCAVLMIDDGRAHEVADFDPLFAAREQPLPLMPVAADGTAGAARDVTVTFCPMQVPDVPPGDLSGLPQDAPYYIQIAAPWSMKETLADGAGVLAKGMTFSSDTAEKTTAQMKSALRMMGLSIPYTLYNMHDMLAESRNYIFIANVFAYTFIAMISLIAAANVFNTISTNIRLRRRELAMLRSVGMADRSFRRMMRFECVFYGTRALAAGLPLALACDVLVFKGMRAAGFDGLRFEMPWAGMAVSIGSVLLVVFATMTYAVRRVRKENIIDALRDEMT